MSRQHHTVPRERRKLRAETYVNSAERRKAEARERVRQKNRQRFPEVAAAVDKVSEVFKCEVSVLYVGPKRPR